VPRGNGSYALKPVIRVVPPVLNGIDGFVDTSLLGSNVMVSAQVGGAVASPPCRTRPKARSCSLVLPPAITTLSLPQTGHATQSSAQCRSRTAAVSRQSSSSAARFLAALDSPEHKRYRKLEPGQRD